MPAAHMRFAVDMLRQRVECRHSGAAIYEALSSRCAFAYVAWLMSRRCTMRSLFDPTPLRYMETEAVRHQVIGNANRFIVAARLSHRAEERLLSRMFCLATLPPLSRIWFIQY